MTDASDPDRKVEQTISLYREATGANLADRYRQGSLIELPAAGEVLILGDLHGNHTNLKKILAVAQLSSHPHRHLILQEVIHGGKPAPSGADVSFRLLEAVAALKVKYPDQVRLIIGNHDLAEYAGHRIYKRGVLLNQKFLQGLSESYGNRVPEVRQAMSQFIASLPLAARTRFGIFISHSTPNGADLEHFRPQVFDLRRLSDELRKGSSVFSLVWGRDFSPAAADRFAELTGCNTFIVGHTPCAGGYELPSHRHVLITSHTQDGCYVLMPLDRELTQEQIVPFIRWINTQ